MKKVYRWIVLAIFIAGLSLRGVYAITGTNIINDILGNNHTHNNDDIIVSDDEHIHSDDHPHDDGVIVVFPKSIEQDDLSEKTYIGSVYSPYYGQVFPFREGMIEKLNVDVGDSVEKGQVLGTLTAQTFVPELADMQASRQAEITIAQGGVQAATYSLDSAKKARDQYVNSLGELGNSLVLSRNTDALTKAIEQQTKQNVEQANAELSQMERSLDLLDNTTEIQRAKLAIDRSSLEQDIIRLQNEVQIAQQKFTGSLRFGYSLLIGVFYPNGFSDQARIAPSLGARNTATRNKLKPIISRLSDAMKNIESQSVDQQTETLALMINAIDAGIEVLENTSAGGSYTTAQLAKDKDALVDAKIDDIGGVVTIGSEIQGVLLALESKQQQITQLQKSFDLQTQSIALEKQKLLQDIELFKSSTKNEITNEYVELQKQKRDLSLNDLELQGRQSEIQNTIREYDQAVVTADAELQIAQAQLRAANQALGILEQGGFNTNITAPFDGTITKRFVTIGNTVSPETAIFDLVDSAKGNEKFVRFEVPEQEFDGIEIDQTIRFVRVQDPIRKYSADIVRIADAIDQESKSILIEAQLSETYEKVLLGSTVIVLFDQPTQVFLVPIDAVFEAEDKELYIRKVVDDIIVQQIVETGKSIGDQIYITSGLNSGDSIVADVAQVQGKETGDTISAVQGFQASDVDQGLEALGDGHDHEH